MPSTTVHIPDAILASIDRIVKERDISRNRFIVQACQKALESDAGQWPEGFFETSLDSDDMKLLREGAAEMELAILSKRRNRSHTDI